MQHLFSSPLAWRGTHWGWWTWWRKGLSTTKET
ncbi:hypothetical protein E2C01_098420 [Portunus trituberculatus]|uniref:Uncharacterized protein n=1 Tax=Portunus trituberculatus TaxID=210409 RepID=A0A5B7KE56_PORTR|nr:hypothetical protein [Portunus trituberculatus]